MALRLKIESLKARGELSGEERDRLLAALAQDQTPKKPRPSRKLVTPLRLFLVGIIVGLTVAYLIWGFVSS